MSLLASCVRSLLLALLLLQIGVSFAAGHDSNSIAAEAEVDTDPTKNGVQSAVELPQPLSVANRKQRSMNQLHGVEPLHANGATVQERDQRSSRRPTLMDIALQVSAREGLNAMTELYGRIEPDIVKNGQVLEDNHPAALLSKFSESVEDSQRKEMAAFATISAAKAFKKNYKYIDDFGRQAHSQKISLRRTALEGLCPPRDPPLCVPATERYRTHDGTCNNKRRLRWGAAQMPFNRFLPPEYGDGVDSIRNSVESGPLSSSRFVSLLVHGARDGEAPLTLMTAQWGQLLDHDVTSTAQPRSINGSVPSCCGGKDFHPSCFPIKVPLDDPWLAPLKVRCLEFLRSAPAQRRDCVLSWREQTNQATSFIDASPIYSNSARSSDNARVFRNGLLVFGRGNPAEDVCQRGAIATQCIRPGDGRSGEQPGLLALHHVWVGEHNRIAMDLSEMNQHWSDEKIFQETRRIVGAMFQHITYREFLPIVLGREVCKLFDLELLNAGYFTGYDHKVNPTVANSFSAAAFRFGHSLIQNSYMRCDRHHNVINNNVSLHEEFQRGDIGSAGSLHRLLRGLATQRALKRDEFITPELTNHLFQTPGFPFGLDLAAINIQRGRDHGIAPYTAWRIPCGLTPIDTWDDFVNVVGPESANRIGHAYRSVHDIDLFVGGIAERPVVGGLVGPTFACIIAQQFSNSRKGDRFWYENGGFESSFTPAQLHTLRRVSLAQVLCRAVGGGTFQPHIFIPAGFPGNARMPCGVDPLAAIDLNPWLEQDPFSAPTPTKTPTTTTTFETQIPERVFDIISTDLNTHTVSILKEDKAGFSNRIKPTKNQSLPLQHTPQIDFIPNASSGFQRPNKNNVTKVNDKLDIRRKTVASKRPAHKPISGVHNKLDKGGTRVTLNIKGVNQRRRTQSTTRRTVVVNNIPIELRSAAGGDKEIETINNTNTSDIKTEANNATKTTTEPKSTTLNTDKLKLPRVEVADKTLEVPNILGVTDITNTEHTEKTPTKVETNEEEVDNSTVDEADIFDVFSILTEPTIEIATTTENSLKTTTVPASNNNDNLNFVSREKTNSRRGKMTNTDYNYQIDHKTDIKAELIDISHQQKAKSMQFKARDNSDIDPMTHSTAQEHKRVQRKLDNKKFINNKLTTTKATSITVRNSLANSTVTEHSNLRIFHKNRTTTTTPTTTPRTVSKRTKTTQRIVELRQYHTIPNYTRPQKVIVAGQNSDQYEIEINIRQTNKSPPSRPVTNYADYTTIYKPYGADRYSSNYADYSSTPAYYQHSPNQPSSTLGMVPRTKPPTVIYLNEHDERTTTRQPGLLQNFITFASSGFAGNRKPFPHGQSSQNERPAFESVTASSVSAFGRPQNSVLSLSSASPQYMPRPQTQYQSQQQLPISSSSFSQVGGGFPGAGGSVAGTVHATSGAVNSGGFSQITAVASANGGDSIFSFNIRPRPSVQTQTQVLSASRPDPGGYGLSPPRQPSHGQLTSPDYFSQPQKDQYYDIPHRESQNSPFSTIPKRPQSQSYYSRTQNEPQQKDTPTDHKPVFLDYDYLSRTLEPITNTNNAEEVDDKDDEYLYDDLGDDENVASGKIFDRDGYLRPEHMTDSLYKAKVSPVTNETNKNSTLLDDNYVLPMLDTSQLNLPLINIPKPMEPTTDDVPKTSTENITDDFPDAVGKHFNNDIQAEDYEDELSEPFIMSKTAALTAMATGTKRQAAVGLGKLPLSSHIAFAPIQILTKPERPDNWVIFETAKEKPLLPELPQFNVDSEPTAEVPMPIQGLRNAWLAKFNKVEDALGIEAELETATDDTTDDELTGPTNFEKVRLSDMTAKLPQSLTFDPETTTFDAFTEQTFQTNDETTTETLEMLPTRPELNLDSNQVNFTSTESDTEDAGLRVVEGA